MEPEVLGMGAHESHFDARTVEYKSPDLAVPLVSGGVDYLPVDIEHQHAVGICTAISLIQNREKANGKRYSPDFQYLLQKKYFDGGWYEGSSIFNALKVAKNFGFLPLELFPHVTESDRYLPYYQYVTKLQAVPDSEIQRLLSLCVDKIPGYASVNVNDPQIMARAILDSEVGILCRYGCGSTWWTNINGNVSWSPVDIDPLRKPVPYTSGHAIVMNKFDYTTVNMQVLSNTWGIQWDKQGVADINWNDYAPTEAWTILKEVPTIPHKFYKLLKYGMRDPEIKELQKVLGISSDGIFGNNTLAAVKAFQMLHGLKADGIVGKLTNQVLNTL